VRLTAVFVVWNAAKSIGKIGWVAFKSRKAENPAAPTPIKLATGMPFLAFVRAVGVEVVTPTFVRTSARTFVSLCSSLCLVIAELCMIPVWNALQNWALSASLDIMVELV